MRYLSIVFSNTVILLACTKSADYDHIVMVCNDVACNWYASLGIALLKIHSHSPVSSATRIDLLILRCRPVHWWNIGLTISANKVAAKLFCPDDVVLASLSVLV